MATFTQNYQLHQWDPQDPFLRTDFNQDLQRLDGALKGLADTAKQQDTELQKRGNCRICVTTYVGNGLCGDEHPNSLTFPWKPEMVSVFGPDGDLMEILYGASRCIMRTSYIGSIILCSWQGNTVEWYVYNPDEQLNTQGSLFTAVAFGIIA